MALLAMLVDHVNVVFFARELGTWATAVGRLAFPLFCLVLASNMARPGVALGRMVRRLWLFGLLALPAHLALFHPASLWPLNVMFLFAAAALAVACWDRGHVFGACVLACIGSVVAEYWLPGMAFLLASVWVFRGGGYPAAIAQLLALALLCWLNGNAWAMWAFLLWPLAYVPLPVPRWRWAFYVLYPAHLWLLWGLRSL